MSLFLIFVIQIVIAFNNALIAFSAPTSQAVCLDSFGSENTKSYNKRSLTVKQQPHNIQLWQVVGYPEDIYSITSGYRGNANRFVISGRSRFLTPAGNPYTIRFTAQDDMDERCGQQYTASGSYHLLLPNENALKIRIDAPWQITYNCLQLKWWFQCIDERTNITVVRIIHSLDRKSFTVIPLKTGLNWLNDRFHFDLFVNAFLFWHSSTTKS